MCYINNGDSMENRYCTNFKDRLLGLMFKKNIVPLCFPKCHAVHTFFMLKPIDIFMTDENHKIIKIYKHAKKRRIYSCKDAYYIYEFPIDYINKKLGDTI